MNSLPHFYQLQLVIWANYGISCTIIRGTRLYLFLLVVTGKEKVYTSILLVPSLNHVLTTKEFNQILFQIFQTNLISHYPINVRNSTLSTGTHFFIIYTIKNILSRYHVK